MKKLSERYIEKYRNKYAGGPAWDINGKYIPDLLRIVELETEEAATVERIMMPDDWQINSIKDELWLKKIRRELNELENKHFPQEKNKE